MQKFSDKLGAQFLLLMVILMFPATGFAHAAADRDGFLAGFLHPVFGFDHLLAMVSVGIVSAQLGGANIWRIPVAFVSAMIVGGTLGIFQIAMPYGEVGIAASVIFLGSSVFYVSKTTPSWPVFCFVFFFGMCHGNAHGLEMPGSVSPAYYTFGFLISTSLLHISGVIIGEVGLYYRRMYRVLRYSGIVMAAIGVSFLVT